MWRLHKAAPVMSLAIITVLVDRNRRRERFIVQHECGHGQQVEGSLSGSTGSNWTRGKGAQQASSTALLVGGGFNVNQLLTMTKKKKCCTSHSHHYFAKKQAQEYFLPFSPDVLLNATITKMPFSTGGTAVCCLSSFSGLR